MFCEIARHSITQPWIFCYLTAMFEHIARSGSISTLSYRRIFYSGEGSTKRSRGSRPTVTPGPPSAMTVGFQPGPGALSAGAVSPSPVQVSSHPEDAVTPPPTDERSPARMDSNMGQCVGVLCMDLFPVQLNRHTCPGCNGPMHTFCGEVEDDEDESSTARRFCGSARNPKCRK